MRFSLGGKFLAGGSGNVSVGLPESLGGGRPLDEKVFENFTVICRGEWLFADLAINQPMCGLLI
jgi:hypothetical protein